MTHDSIDQLSPALQEKFWLLQKSYVQGLAERLNMLLLAAQANDLVALASCAHRLCGSASGFGFERLSQLARQLEQCCSTAQSAQRSDAIELIASEIAQIRHQATA